MDFISLDRMFGLYPSGRRGLEGSFTISGMAKQKWRVDLEEGF